MLTQGVGTTDPITILGRGQANCMVRSTGLASFQAASEYGFFFRQVESGNRAKAQEEACFTTMVKASWLAAG
jgi:hypothetical protein